MIRIHKISSMSILFVFSSKLVSSLIQVQTSQFIFRSGTKNPVRRHVHLHGNVSLRVGKSKNRRTHGKIVPSNSSTHSFGEKPPDPEMLTSSEYLNENVDKLFKWFQGKKNVLCITGAGISTDSGIPDYRGHEGAYHKGHKPVVHDQFMSSQAIRQRYWGRSMVGWKEFSSAIPNAAHHSLAKLEKMGYIGVDFDDKSAYHDEDDIAMRWAFSDGSQKMSIITQNVDGLHSKAGSPHITELHGRNDRIKCMNCGSYHCRHEFHASLRQTNSKWLEQVKEESLNQQSESNSKTERRPDGDAFITNGVDDVYVPPCLNCGNGFYKPDVVFFGDTVPKHRVERCFAAVDNCDGLLCIGSSLAVHSAYRFVNHAAKRGVPIAVLNVGETRAEISGLELLKIEAPASQTLKALVDKLETN